MCVGEAGRGSVCSVAVQCLPPGSITLAPETVSSPWTAAADTQTLGEAPKITSPFFCMIEITNS